MFQKLSLRALAFTLVVLASSTSYSGPREICRNFFSARLFIKDPIPPAPLTRFGYFLAPFRAMDEVLIDKPTRVISKKILGSPKELGFLSKLPIYIAMSAASWGAIDNYIFWPTAEKEATLQILDHVTKNASDFDRLIESDYRYEEIKNKRDQALLTFKAPLEGNYHKMNHDQLIQYIETPVVQSRVLAYGLLTNYTQYYQTYDSIPNPKALTLSEQEEKFKLDPLFQHLNFFFQNGVRQYPGSHVSKENQGALSDKQKLELYNLTHDFYLKYRTLDMVFKNQLPQASFAQKQMKDNIFSDPYTQKLIVLYRNQKISSGDLFYYLQEDAKMSYYMSLFQTLHITNFKEVNGQFTQEPETLEDLRQSRLESIEESL